MLRALALTTVLALSACAQANRPTPAIPPSEDRVHAEEIVHVTGLANVRIGSHRSEITRHLNEDLPGCNTQLESYPQGSLVFTADDRFVLMWFEAPLRTPDGVTTGTRINEVKKLYPQAAELKAPARSYRFDGLLVTSGEHGYLFLHDGETVQKAIAGYVDYLHRLFDAGFGVC